ncbi:hypothetical protein HDU93_003707, partial [Gonapodya sp. JEL0774]
MYTVGKGVLEPRAGRNGGCGVGEVKPGEVGLTWEGSTAVVPSTDPSSASAKVVWRELPDMVAFSPPYAIAAPSSTSTLDQSASLTIAHLPSSEEVQSISLSSGPRLPYAASLIPRGSAAGVTYKGGQLLEPPNRSRSASITSSAAPGDIAAATNVTAVRSRAGSIASVRSRAGSTMGFRAPGTMRVGIISAVGRVWVWCGGKVGVLVEIGWAERVKRLVIGADFHSAVAYVENGEGVPEDLRASLSTRLRLLHAHHLFSVVQDYSAAMNLFLELDVDPRQVCGLFPAVRTWGDMEASVSGPQVDDDSAYPHRARDPPPHAYAALVRFLTERRMRTLRSRQDILRGRSPSTLDAGREIARLERIACVVDTCLLSVYLAAKSSLVRPLMRVENWVDVGVAQAWLEGEGRYEELLDLHFAKGMHSRAVEFLKRLGHDQTSRLFGPVATIAYLKRLGETDLDLVLEASSWALESAPEEALEIFTDPPYSPSSPTRHRVLAHLADISDDLATAYLEHLVYDLNDPTPDLHENLIVEYLADVPEEEAAVIGEGLPDGSARRRLREFLEFSKVYRPDLVLWRFPTD